MALTRWGQTITLPLGTQALEPPIPSAPGSIITPAATAGNPKPVGYWSASFGCQALIAWLSFDYPYNVTPAELADILGMLQTVAQYNADWTLEQNAAAVANNWYNVYAAWAQNVAMAAAQQAAAQQAAQATQSSGSSQPAADVPPTPAAVSKYGLFGTLAPQLDPQL